MFLCANLAACTFLLHGEVAKCAIALDECLCVQFLCAAIVALPDTITMCVAVRHVRVNKKTDNYYISNTDIFNLLFSLDVCLV